MVQEITSSSREQNVGAEQINLSIQQLDAVIQQNASVSEEMAATAEELMGQAEQLRGKVSFFVVEENRFNMSFENEDASAFSQGTNAGPKIGLIEEQ